MILDGWVGYICGNGGSEAGKEGNGRGKELHV